MRTIRLMATVFVAVALAAVPVVGKAGQGTVDLAPGNPLGLDRVSVTPSRATLSPGEVQPFAARGFDAAGDELPITPAWQATGGPITAGGLYTAGDLPGRYRITATSEEGGPAVQGVARALIAGSLPPDLEPGEAYCHAFSHPGHYPYYDEADPRRTGQVVVLDPEPPPTLQSLELATPDLPAGRLVLSATVTVPVSITAEGFSPASVAVRISDTVCWTNLDTVAVTVEEGPRHAIRGGVYEQDLFLPLVPRGCELPPTEWDPRLDLLGVGLMRAAGNPCAAHWHLVAARWADPVQSAGRHQIFVEVLNGEGARAVTEVVVVQWPGGSVQIPAKTDPRELWGWVFDMYNTLGSYDAYVGGPVASDQVSGMGMGTIEYPNVKLHTSFYLTYRWAP